MDQISFWRRDNDSGFGVFEEKTKFFGLIRRIHWSRNQPGASGRKE